MKRNKGIEQTIINRIKNNSFNFESVQRKGEYFGKRVNVNELRVSYGVVGYVIYTDNAEITVDFELNKVDVQTLN